MKHMTSLPKVNSGDFRKLVTVLVMLSVLSASVVFVGATQTEQKPERPKYPDINEGRGKTRGNEPTDKLTPELRILYGQYTQTRGGGADLKFNVEQLRSLFGISDGNVVNPYVNVTVRVETTSTIADLKRNGAQVYLRADDIVFTRTQVLSLERIANQKSVLSINATKSVTVPPIPRSIRSPDFEPMTRGGTREVVQKVDNQFNSQKLTGKGVIVGIVDTGIDWKHQDFIKADGTSRILYLWDFTDDSFEKSGGKVGMQPPILQPGGDPGPGTVYTNEQSNAALRGQGTVNSMDNFGHGTASAGTAAGNGRATANGLPAGTYPGVAPDADLVIVKAGDCEGFDGTYLLGTYWITQIAKSRRQPVVINHSLGGHVSSHDGTEPEELTMNSWVGAGKPGVAITVSAGNEGNYSMHASGKFGPRIKGQADIDGSPMEVMVSAQRTEGQTWLNGYFRSDDEWGLAIRGSGDFLVDEKGQPFNVYIFKVGGEVKIGFPREIKKPKYFDEFANMILEKTKLAERDERVDRVWVPLPPGSYYLWGFGPTEKVRHGDFDLYLPFYSQGAFTIGAQKNRMVGSPGNAANVITVGSYDFRKDWENADGGRTTYNLTLNNISDYSSPGGLTAVGGFKPEMTAPARYTISSLSQAAKPGSPACKNGNMGSVAGTSAVTRDGMHIAWSGTSAAAPFTAGVIALMLQKNPNLDARQIKAILIKTATKGDKFVGAVPNAEWGYGRIDPAAAVAATPPAAGGPRPRPRPRITD